MNKNACARTAFNIWAFIPYPNGSISGLFWSTSGLLGTTQRDLPLYKPSLERLKPRYTLVKRAFRLQ